MAVASFNSYIYFSWYPKYLTAGRGVLAADAGMGFEARNIAETELRAADEIWLSSASRGVLAITTLDRAPVGNGNPGPMFRQMHARFQTAKRKA